MVLLLAPVLVVLVVLVVLLLLTPVLVVLVLVLQLAHETAQEPLSASAAQKQESAGSSEPFQEPGQPPSQISMPHHPAPRRMAGER